jgi:short-subunit dehydrogenase
MNKDQKKGWALVTGASAGIGEEFCIQLAALSWIHLLRVSRRLGHPRTGESIAFLHVDERG